MCVSRRSWWQSTQSKRGTSMYLCVFCSNSYKMRLFARRFAERIETWHSAQCWYFVAFFLLMWFHFDQCCCTIGIDGADPMNDGLYSIDCCCLVVSQFVYCWPQLRLDRCCALHRLHRRCTGLVYTLLSLLV